MSLSCQISVLQSDWITEFNAKNLRGDYGKEHTNPEASSILQQTEKEEQLLKNEFLTPCVFHSTIYVDF